MKIRNKKKRKYIFYAHKYSNLNKWKRSYVFKYKSELMNFLNNNFVDSLNGNVHVDISNFNGFGTEQTYFVWYNDYKANKEGYKIVLKKNPKRHINRKISKSSKKYFAFSDKVYSLMNHISDSYEDISTSYQSIDPRNAKNLVKLFYKRGFKDEGFDEDDLEYINSYLESGVDFFHWSDRCGNLRMKVIIEYFKKHNLI
jgi:hypothetical protein